MPNIHPGFYNYPLLQPTLPLGAPPIIPCLLGQCRLRVCLVSSAPIWPLGNITIQQQGIGVGPATQLTQMVATQSAQVMWNVAPNIYTVTLNPVIPNWTLVVAGNANRIHLDAQQDILLVLQIRPDPWIEIRVVEKQTAPPNPTDVWNTTMTLTLPAGAGNVNRAMPAALPVGAAHGAVREMGLGVGTVAVVEVAHPVAGEVWEVVDVVTT